MFILFCLNFRVHLICLSFFAGELDGNRAEPPQKPEWFRRFICFSIEKKSTEYLIIPFTGMEININKVYRYK